MTKAADIDPAKKVHPWRLCQYGQCAEKPHDRSITPSRHHPDGKTIVHFYCKDIESGKDVLVPLEMQVIASEHFLHLAGPPKADDLGFKTDGNAYDLLIRGWTRNEHGELKDHFVDIPKAALGDSNLNIAGGIRWLFRKHETATSKLGRAATWDEAVADYKSYLKDINSHGMGIFRNYYRKLKA